MGRPREHDETTRQLLLDAAERLAGVEGAGAVSVRRLADEVGTTTRAIYSLFGSKEGLVRALYRVGFGRLEAHLAGVDSAEDPLDELRGLGIAYRHAARAQPNLYELMFGRPVAEFAPGDRDYVFARSTLNHLRQAVRRAADDGRLRGDVESTTMQLWALVHGLASLELGGVPTETDFEAIWTTALDNLLAGLQAG